MILWIVLTLMTVVAAVGLMVPLVRRYDRRRVVDGVSGVLGEQLAAIDTEAATLAPADAEALRADVGRRLISEAPGPTPASRALGGRGLIALGVGIVAVIGVSTTLLYTRIGRPDLIGTPVGSIAAPPDGGGDASPHQGMDPAVLITQLETRMRQTPNDVDGWRMLGWSYMRTGRYAEAAQAYGRALTLDPGNGELLSAQGEAITQAAGGEVTPPAETAFRGALARDNNDPRAKFYLALATYQHGDHAAAMASWTALLKGAPAGAPWVPDVRSAIVRIAAKSGQDVSGELPTSGATDATSNEAAAIQQAAPAEQAAMIQGMVASLDARLKTNPRDPDGWTRLMRARMVLGDPSAATAAYRRAMTAYADSPAQRTAFTAAAKDLRIPGV